MAHEVHSSIPVARMANDAMHGQAGAAAQAHMGCGDPKAKYRERARIGPQSSEEHPEALGSPLVLGEDLRKLGLQRCMLMEIMRKDCTRAQILHAVPY
eukprot:CAMPEP_0119333860 /NCGR_PEP_ID=MMETSP1333-20130426/86137_1 /TAXON_ID=418940 /ORGANISM="Scyphosphaera apsteinii, Strain RCC1455" /LENGTH=97 /DNA_ID=CAMNT_0007344027 /DNA_START=115 /DNA_END=406 /DNA_ORIENTATION=-